MLNLITTKQSGEKKNDKSIKKTINNVYPTQLTTNKCNNNETIKRIVLEYYIGTDQFKR